MKLVWIENGSKLTSSNNSLNNFKSLNRIAVGDSVKVNKIYAVLCYIFDELWCLGHKLTKC